MAKRAVSLKTIAEKANVSVSTVSLVLNNKGKQMRISSSTQEKIRKITAELESPFPASTNNPRISISSCKDVVRVAVFFENSHDAFPLDLFNQGMSLYASESDLFVDWVYHPYKKNGLRNLSPFFNKHFYDGIIIVAPYNEDVLFLQENRFPIPVILYNFRLNHYTSICLDNYAVGQAAAEVFFRHGHQKIAIIKPSAYTKSISSRIAGFCDYLTYLNFTDETLRSGICPRKDISGGYTAISELFSNRFIPTAIFSVHDFITVGIMNFLFQHHVRIPEDMEILSFGNTAFADAFVPSISSYAPKSDVMAYMCLQKLIEEMRGQAQPGLSYEVITECVWRSSCRK